MMRDAGADPDLLCGHQFVVKEGVVFDPGGLGPYFQYDFEIEENKGRLQELLAGHPDWRPKFTAALEMFDAALKAKMGLYVWF